MRHVPFRHRFGPIPVRVLPTGHSAWDIALFILAAVASAGAVLGIWIWVLQLRKTPEVRFDWSRSGIPWPVDEVQTLELGRAINLLLVITNVGTGAADGVIINVVVPSFTKIVGNDFNGKPVENFRASDNVVDDPPDHIVTWIASRNREFYPSLPIVINLGIEIDNASTGQIHHPRDHIYFVATSVEAVGLPAAGRRFIPSWAHRVPGEGSQRLASITAHRWWPKRLHWGVDDFWGQTEFPGRRYRRSLRRVRALPRDHVRCGPGKRQDRRPFIVDWPPSPQPVLLAGDSAPPE